MRLHPLPAGHRHRGRAHATTPARSAAAAPALTHAPLEHSGLDVRWEDGAGAVLARFGGAAPRPQAEAAARVLREAGLDAELVDDDDELWDAQRDAQRARPGEPDTVVRVSGAADRAAGAARAPPRDTRRRSWAARRSGSPGCAWTDPGAAPDALAGPAPARVRRGARRARRGARAVDAVGRRATRPRWR